MSLFSNHEITTWRKFAHEVRGKQSRLLTRLGDFKNSILVTGCQRSGSTMLSQIITQSDGIVNYKFGKDSELDAALILSGRIPQSNLGRYCFQTTYLNECYHEYFDHPENHIIWVIRNPYSVVYSMLYNWKDFALNELFIQCGYAHMDCRDRIRFQRFGMFGIPRIRRAAYAYKGKISQLCELRYGHSEKLFSVVEYDDLICNKMRIFPLIYDRIGLIYREEYTNSIRKESLSKKDKLSYQERSSIDDICMQVYQDVQVSEIFK